MSILVCVDHLLKRTHETYLLDLLLEIFTEADIGTLAHRPDMILGEVERRHIKSSFLSRLCPNEKKLAKYAPLLAGAAKALNEELEKLDYLLSFKLSFGLGHLIQANPECKDIAYLYADRIPTNGVTKFLIAHVREKQKRALRQYDGLFVSSQYLKEKLNLDKAIVMPPPLKVQDFPLYPDKELSLDYYVVELEGLSNKDILILCSLFNELKTKVKFVGHDEHLNSHKEKYQENDYIEFWGERCTGDLSVLLSNSRAVMGLGQEFFPWTPMHGLLSGRPFIVLDMPINREFLKIENGLFVSSLKVENLRASILEMERIYSKYSRSSLRNNPLYYSEYKFKKALQAKVVELLPGGNTK